MFTLFLKNTASSNGIVMDFAFANDEFLRDVVLQNPFNPDLILSSACFQFKSANSLSDNG